jgi:hypothetical protein
LPLAQPDPVRQHQNMIRGCRRGRVRPLEACGERRQQPGADRRHSTAQVRYSLEQFFAELQHAVGAAAAVRCRPDSGVLQRNSVKCRSASFRQGLLTSIVRLRCAEMARAFSYPQLLSPASNCEAVRVSPHYRISSSSLFLSDNPARPALPQLPPRVRRAAGLKLAQRRTVRTQPRRCPLTNSTHAPASQNRWSCVRAATCSHSVHWYKT